MGSYFATNPKMVLINVEQCIIWDIVLVVGFKLKKFNYSSAQCTVDKRGPESDFDFLAFLTFLHSRISLMKGIESSFV